MRLTLALEASSRTYAVAVGDGEQLRAQRASRRDDREFAGLGELVAQALAAADATFSDIGTIAVDVGPGGLTSIRAAVAYANGLAFSLGVQVFAATSLELMAMAARRAHPGPLLCLKRGSAGNTYAGRFTPGEAAEMRYGPASSVVPALADGMEMICVAGAHAADLTDLLPVVTVRDTGIMDADVTVLYEAAVRVAKTDPERLVPAASAVNEGSWIFHHPAGSSRSIVHEVREER